MIVRGWPDRVVDRHGVPYPTGDFFIDSWRRDTIDDLLELPNP